MLTKHLSTYLDRYLAADLDVIPFMLWVNTMMDVILHAVYKEFSFLVDYPKVYDDQFQHWLKKSSLCATCPNAVDIRVSVGLGSGGYGSSILELQVSELILLLDLQLAIY